VNHNTQHGVNPRKARRFTGAPLVETPPFTGLDPAVLGFLKVLISLIPAHLREELSLPHSAPIPIDSRFGLVRAKTKAGDLRISVSIHSS